jgi:hypothetical protein
MKYSVLDLARIFDQSKIYRYDHRGEDDIELLQYIGPKKIYDKIFED